MATVEIDTQLLDPTRFRAENASAELKAAIAELRDKDLLMLDRPLDPDAAEAFARRNDAKLGLDREKSDRAEARSIPGDVGEIPLRIFRPAAGEPRGVMLHFHGGGWYKGSADMNDPLLERRADALGISIVSVEYRLAPRHPYPAGPDDCEAAGVWLAHNALREFGTDVLLIGGESAGAHLAAVTILRMRDRGVRFAGANLVYGLYDLSGVPSHTEYDEAPLMLDSKAIWSITKMFAPDEAQWTDPDVSPLYADLSRLAPALFTVGTSDPLRDHTLFMATRWIAAGSPAELAVYPGGPHGFDVFACPEQDAAHRRMERFLDGCLRAAADVGG